MSNSRKAKHQSIDVQLIEQLKELRVLIENNEKQKSLATLDSFTKAFEKYSKNYSWESEKRDIFWNKNFNR